MAARNWIRVYLLTSLIILFTGTGGCEPQQLTEALGVVHGKVGDENGRAISSAVVRVEGSNYSCLTNGDGRYLLNLPPGNYTLAATAEGYRKLSIPVSLGGGNLESELDFTLIGSAVPPSSELLVEVSTADFRLDGKPLETRAGDNNPDGDSGQDRQVQDTAPATDDEGADGTGTGTASAACVRPPYPSYGPGDAVPLFVRITNRSDGGLTLASLSFFASDGMGNVVWRTGLEPPSRTIAPGASIVAETSWKWYADHDMPLISGGTYRCYASASAGEGPETLSQPVEVVLKLDRPRPSPIDFKILAEGRQSRIRGRMEMVIRDQASLEELWKQLDVDRDVPGIDFTKHSVIAVTGGGSRWSGGFVSVMKIEELPGYRPMASPPFTAEEEILYPLPVEPPVVVTVLHTPALPGPMPPVRPPEPPVSLFDFEWGSASCDVAGDDTGGGMGVEVDHCAPNRVFHPYQVVITDRRLGTTVRFRWKVKHPHPVCANAGHGAQDREWN